jgi:hypothetical protein
MSSILSRQPTQLVPHHQQRRVVEGFKLPDDRPELTENELAWIQILRAIVGDRDPPVTLPAVDALRQALTDR